MEEKKFKLLEEKELKLTVIESDMTLLEARAKFVELTEKHNGNIILYIEPNEIIL